MSSTQPPIRVAFLGVDASTPRLLRAVLDHPQFDLAGICQFEGGVVAAAAELQQAVGQIRPITEWESLLDDRRVGAVVVSAGSDADLRTEQLRKFIQTGRPVLVSHPVVSSMLVYYELDMIRRETGSPVVPLLAERNHPAARALADIVGQGADSPIGKVEQLNFERCIAAPTKENVERQFARDVDLIRSVAGDMTRLGALSGASGEAGFASLGVHMSGPLEIAARWSVVPIGAAAGARITVTGPRGRATIDLAQDGEAWTMECAADGEPQTQTFAGWDGATASLDQLAATIAGEPALPDWVDACRAIELTETIERSREKGRTIELYYEDYTEDATFKGTMTSLGCGLLLLSIFMLGVVGVAEQMKIPYVGYWKYVLVVLFAVFLVMQLVMLTSPKSRVDDVDGQDRANQKPLVG